MKKVIKINMSGYGRESVTLSFDNEPTLREALEAAGWVLGASESVSVDGVPAEMDNILENGDTVLVVGKKDGGNI